MGLADRNPAPEKSAQVIDNGADVKSEHRPKSELLPVDFIKASAPSRAERSWQLLLTDQGLEEEGAERVVPL